MPRARSQRNNTRRCAQLNTRTDTRPPACITQFAPTRTRSGSPGVTVGRDNRAGYSACQRCQNVVGINTTSVLGT